MTKTIAFSLLVALSTTALAAEKEPAVANAMTVTLDKETGQYRAPTAAERAALDADAARLAAAAAAAPATTSRFPLKSAPRTEAEASLTQKVSADGTVRMQVPESLYSTVEATVDADGAVKVQHAGQYQEAEHE